jgi:hypothetical protein
VCAFLSFHRSFSAGGTSPPSSPSAPNSPAGWPRLICRPSDDCERANVVPTDADFLAGGRDALSALVADFASRVIADWGGHIHRHADSTFNRRLLASVWALVFEAALALTRATGRAPPARRVPKRPGAGPAARQRADQARRGLPVRCVCVCMCAACAGCAACVQLCFFR